MSAYSTVKNGRESAFSLVELLMTIIIMSITIIVMITMVTQISKSVAAANGSEHYQETFDKFEQWSVAHPYEAAQITSNVMSYNDVAELINGTDPELPGQEVLYIHKDNGHFQFCIIPDKNPTSIFEYHSEDQTIEESETCTA